MGDALGFVYALALAVWFVLSRLLGDQPGYLGLATSLALYAYVPLPAFALFAALRRRRTLGLALLVPAVLFAAQWGRLFVPPVPGAHAGGPSLTVMSYNGLGRNADVPAFLAAIRGEGADLVLLQELNPEQARAVEAELADLYPHRVLDPRVGVRGMGALSRHPLRRLPDAFRSEWECANQTLELLWNDRPVRVLNFHLKPHPETLGDAAKVAAGYARREREARDVAAYVRSLPADHPVIAAGDANVSDTNRAYRILTASLRDGFAEAGFGFGNTFPNRAAAGHGGMKRLGFDTPSWLVRIDYVFHSPLLRAVSARTARSAGGSDHRGVIVELSPARSG